MNSPKTGGDRGGSRPAFICPRHVPDLASTSPKSVAPLYPLKSRRQWLAFTAMAAFFSMRHQPRLECSRRSYWSASGGAVVTSSTKV